MVADIGSGLLAPEPVLPDEPDAATALASGAALVTASGDKLLGGPQAGLLLGRGDLIAALRRHPLARALRVDKLTLAALEATLRGPATPTATALHEPVERLRDRAGRLAARLAAPAWMPGTESEAVVGGGGAPGVRLPSAAVSLPATLGSSLRKNNPPVAGRIEDGRLLLDLRTVDPADDDLLREAVLAAAAQGQDAARSRVVKSAPDPAVVVVQPDDVVLAEVVAVLHLHEHQRPGAGVADPVRGAQPDVNRVAPGRP